MHFCKGLTLRRIVFSILSESLMIDPSSFFLIYFPFGPSDGPFMILFTLRGFPKNGTGCHLQFQPLFHRRHLLLLLGFTYYGIWDSSNVWLIRIPENSMRVQRNREEGETGFDTAEDGRVLRVRSRTLGYWELCREREKNERGKGINWKHKTMIINKSNLSFLPKDTVGNKKASIQGTFLFDWVFHP
jgi:hypothetical protein